MQDGRRCAVTGAAGFLFEPVPCLDRAGVAELGLAGLQRLAERLEFADVEVGIASAREMGVRFAAAWHMRTGACLKRPRRRTRYGIGWGPAG